MFSSLKLTQLEGRATNGARTTGYPHARQ
jgi:hypothetical protein